MGSEWGETGPAEKRSRGVRARRIIQREVLIRGSTSGPWRKWAHQPSCTSFKRSFFLLLLYFLLYITWSIQLYIVSPGRCVFFSLFPMIDPVTLIAGLSIFNGPMHRSTEQTYQWNWLGAMHQFLPPSPYTVYRSNVLFAMMDWITSTGSGQRDWPEWQI
jgi:hypothetical protein